MVKLSTTVYCLIATLVIPGLAATVSDLSSAIADVVAKVNAQDANLGAVPAGSTVSVGNAFVCCGTLQVSPDLLKLHT